MKPKLCLLVLLLGIFIISNGQIPTDGLVGYWPFNGNANDESGKGNHGTVYGATLTADRFGSPNSVYNFDGIDDYIEAPADSLPSSDRTVSLWFNLDSINNAPTPFAYGGGGYGTSWLMCINHTEKPNTFHLEAHWNVHELDYYYENEPVNEWYHWAITTSSEGTKMYLNGIFVASNTDYISSTGVLGKSLGIGVCCSSGGIVPYTDRNVGYFNGKIDDICIYNRALNQAGIDSLYTGTNTGINPSININTIEVYPNPARDVIHINTGNNYEQMTDYTIKIINTTGIVIFESNVNGSLFNIDVSDFDETGLYFIQIIDNTSQIVDTKKIILE